MVCCSAAVVCECQIALVFSGRLFSLWEKTKRGGLKLLFKNNDITPLYPSMFLVSRGYRSDNYLSTTLIF